jgi:hypothetical protein
MRALLLTSIINLPNTAFKPKYHIHYDHQDDLLARSDNLPEDLKIDTLLFSGTHGTFVPGNSELNDIPEADVVRLTDKLRQKNKGTLKNIVLDPCDSACFIPRFKNLLDNEGVIYCNISKGRQHNSIEIFKDYEIFKDLNLGITFFNLISLMAARDVEINDDVKEEVTYPSIYQKNDNTLYYYGPANDEIIDYLRNQEINVVEIKNLNSYLEKLSLSKTPIEEGRDQLALTNECVNDWPKLNQPTLDNDEVKNKLIGLFAKHFKDKEKLSVEKYTKMLFPVARRLTKEGENPIKILAMAACQYRLGYQTEKDVTDFSNAISRELQTEFAFRLLQNELFKKLEKTPKPTPVQLKSIKEDLRAYGKVILGDKFLQPLEPIIDSLLPPATENPAVKTTIVDKTTIIKFNWLGAFKSAVLVGLVVAAGLYFAASIGISLSLISITKAALASSLLLLLKDVFVFRFKLTHLNQYTKNDISTINEEKLKSFMEGTKNTLKGSIASTFSYRGWYYMQDYYAGLAATENNCSELIGSVEKRLTVLGAKP